MMDEPLEKYGPIEKLDLGKYKMELPKTVKHIHCPSCKTEVAAQNISLETSMAKCGSCNAIFSIDEELQDVKTKALSETKQVVLRPEGIDLFQFRNELNITVQPHIQGLDLWALVFTPIIAVFSIILFFSDKTNFHFLIPAFFSLIAVFYIIKALAYSRNKVYIDVNSDYLSIRARPKNFQKDKEYSADEIAQVYLKHNINAPGHYNIFLLVNSLEGQKHVKLLTVNSLSKAKYIEQEIERYLEIEDQVVPEALA